MNNTGKSSCSNVLCFNSNTSGVESFLSPLENIAKVLSRRLTSLLHSSYSPFKHLTHITELHSTHHTEFLQIANVRLFVSEMRSLLFFLYFSVIKNFLSLSEFNVFDNARFRQLQHDELSRCAEKAMKLLRMKDMT